MSVRKIPKNYRNLTGLASSDKSTSAFFESTLERDCLALLEFDTNVEYYDVQPVCIEWTDTNGKNRTYTPDVLITYCRNFDGYKPYSTVLCEIKYRSDIKKNWDELKPKFKAAISYAKAHGWRFKVLTETEIRTAFMENARFLLPYLNNELDESYEFLLRTKLLELRESTIDALLNSVFQDKWSQAELIPCLWQLIAMRRISTDLTQPLTMSSKIWSLM